MRIRKGAALKILETALNDIGWDSTSAFTVKDQPRDVAADLNWWHQNTPANEASDTKRNLAYLRAYLEIAGRDRLTARGLQLERGRLWMDRSVISRLERDGYLSFHEKEECEFEPTFALTSKGKDWIEV